jgi:hypothetical protein
MSHRADCVALPNDENVTFETCRKNGRYVRKIEVNTDRVPMSTLELVFDGKTFAVPKKSVFELLEHHKLFEAKSYAVQSSVSLAVFEMFVDSLQTQKKISVVTKGNATFLCLLAKEFFLSEFAAECGTFSVSVDQFLALSERVSKLELQSSSSFSSRPGQVEEAIECQEEELERLRLTLGELKTLVEGKLGQPKSGSVQRRPESNPSPSPSPNPSPPA